MALKKLCRCGKTIDYYDSYCEKCKKEMDQEKKNQIKYYDTHHRDKESQTFYNSKPWKIAREIVRRRDSGLCIVCRDNKEIVSSDVVHHIVPLKEDRDKGLDINNLICLCDSCHNIIHREIDKGIDDKDKMRRLIQA